VWYDPIDALLTGALVHDLDLVIRDPEGKMHWGNGVDFGDYLNPTEQVTIPSPRCASGNCVYTVIVRGYSVAALDAQPFGIVMTTAGAVSKEVESDESIFAFDTAPIYANPAITVTSTDTEEMIRAELGSFSIIYPSSFTTKFTIGSSNPLSKIFIEFSEWEDPSNCPFGLSVTITDPLKRVYTIVSWPYSHGVCLFELDSPYTSTYFPHSVGVDLSTLGGAGEWSVKISAAYSIFPTAMVAKAAVVLTLAKQKPTFAIKTIPRLNVEYPYQSIFSIQVSGLSECSSLDYVTMKYYKSGNCDGFMDVFDLTDPAGRRVALHPVFDWTWFAYNKQLYSVDLVSAARLGGNGVYTLGLYFEDFECDFNSGYIDVAFHYGTDSTCSDAGVISEGEAQHSSTFDATISSCIVEHPEYIGDGKCNSEGGYNVASCGYDGGDCCAESCQSGTYECDPSSYVCLDPEASYGCFVEYPDWVGDGYCDYDSYGYNTPQCNYDNGDCCKESCIPTYFECGSNGFVCVDPNYIDARLSGYKLIDEFEQIGALFGCNT
jgi:hypothetical protein